MPVSSTELSFLVFIFLLTNDVGDLFKCSFAMCVSFCGSVAIINFFQVGDLKN